MTAGLTWVDQTAFDPEGRRRFRIVQERAGWKLYRYKVTDRNGKSNFQSKETVLSETLGRVRADNLWRLEQRPPGINSLMGVEE